MSEQPNFSFAKLQRVSARAGWPHEAQRFTPWLAENVELLGEALGLALETKEREHAVGRYSLDLLLEDSGERVVIVENQFGSTDHDHLGKLLTYCAGTEAEVVIWIAERLNEEHAAALEWLNDNTRSGIAFFGVELELLKIAESPLAPNFRVVVQPNEWTKNVRPAEKPVTGWDWSKYREDLAISDDRLGLGRALLAQLEQLSSAAGLPWRIRFNKGFITLLTPKAYRVAIIDLYWQKAPRFAIRLPDDPATLGIESPLPGLPAWWDPRESMWGWTIPAGAPVPDLRDAFELGMRMNPEFSEPAASGLEVSQA